MDGLQLDTRSPTVNFGEELKVCFESVVIYMVSNTKGLVTVLLGCLQTCQRMGTPLSERRLGPLGTDATIYAQVMNGIAWLDDIQTFYRERAAIEKEYATKLNALAKKYFEKKAKKSSSLSVGDTPDMTPGSLERCV